MSGSLEPVAYLRDAENGEAEWESLVVCSEGDPAGFPVVTKDSADNLLEALDWLVSAVATGALQNDGGFYLNKARAAIAKAEGSQSSAEPIPSDKSREAK